MPLPVSDFETSVAHDVTDASDDWHGSLARAIRDADELVTRLELGHVLTPESREAAKSFPVMVPLSYLRRMQVGDVHDPLLRQVLPLDAEMQIVPGFSVDAVQDASFRDAPGLLKKYHGRALLIATGSCAVHCRYCFRRHYPYGDEPRRLDDWQPALDAIAHDESITEVLLSGGDPLMLTDQRLDDLLSRLERIDHLKRVRIHTRLPIVLPNRMTSVLIERLTGSRLTPIVVVHANHANELIDDCGDSVRNMVRSGLTVLNQAVLLNGVNDSLSALVELSESLINLGAIPYYLHQLDRVAGTAHFEVPIERGKKLVKQMREHLPGYAVPRYVTEVPNEPHKIVIE